MHHFCFDEKAVHQFLPTNADLLTKGKILLKTRLVGLVTLFITTFVNAEGLTSFQGHFERYVNGKLDSDAAFIDVKIQESGEYWVSGIALWIVDPSAGRVNIGEIDGTFSLSDNEISYDLDGCKLLITFSHNALTVTNDNMMCGGLNVSFNGTYLKKAQEK